MLYCSIDDASNNSLKDKFDQYDRINKYNKINDNNHPSYFTAQGDYESNNYDGNNFGHILDNDEKNKVKGTTIKQLKKIDNDKINNIVNKKANEDLLSLDDSFTFDDISLNTKYTNNNNIDHEAYVNIITKELLNDNSSLMSSHNGKIYKHVKSCKICKSKIKHIMKDQYCDPIVNNVIGGNVVENFDSSYNIIGYDVKELLLIILGGIILIFVFDLLVKMGSRLNR